MSLPARSDFARHWVLDPSIVFLNHGSFGATPRVVLAKQDELRGRMEAEPVRFFVRELEPLIDEARSAVASFVGAKADDLAFVPNATTGVNAVLQSLSLSPGDELITTDHVYNACKNALEFVAARSGARVVIVTVPVPIEDPAQVVESVLAAVTPNTRLALIDHITSPTGMVLPVVEIVRALDARGVDTLVDGAHAPGMVPLDLDTLGAAYYTANCHKWVCAPKGAAFLHVRCDRQASLRPVVISHGANAKRPERSRFHLEFDWTGTTDPTAFLCIPEAIRFMSSLLPGGFAAVMEANRTRAIEGREILQQALGANALCPTSMIGSLAAVKLPEGRASNALSLYGDPLQDRLFERHAIEVPIVPWPAPPARLVRISAQLYGTLDEVRYLARSLATEIAND